MYSLHIYQRNPYIGTVKINTSTHRTPVIYLTAGAYQLPAIKGVTLKKGHQFKL